MEKIGRTQEEIDAGQIFECRQITKNIINIGISEKQKLKIIELLSLELESRDAMELILKTVKEIKNLDHNIKFSLNKEDNDYNKNKSGLLDL